MPKFCTAMHYFRVSSKIVQCFSNQCKIISSKAEGTKANPKKPFLRKGSHSNPNRTGQVEGNRFATKVFY